MISDARRGHVSPGIYTEERDVTYSVKSLGITSLGLVGETLYGPAFENIEIKDWTEFVDYFGGTSPEKYKGTGLPKYELPYIAKSYLEESRRLNVVRVLGLSGYDAGPCWVVKTNDNKPLVILRSKMEYNSNAGNPCETISDKPDEIVNKITIKDYIPKSYDGACATLDYSNEIDPYYTTVYRILKDDGTYSPVSGYYETEREARKALEDINATGASGSIVTSGITIQNKRFCIEVNVNDGNSMGYKGIYKYNVSLDPNDSDYIYRVISASPETGSTPIYIEAVFESNLLSSDSIHKGEADYLTDDEYTNFFEMYRPAQTPWIVSEAYASVNESSETVITMRKLFKFITISDGDASNYQVKVSIQKINPFNGTFDVVVRNFNDTDNNPIVLEKFSNCNLIKGDSNYIGIRIGTLDGGFESKSKYITVAMATDEDLSNSVPCGFLGFPMHTYSKTNTTVAVNPDYNTKYDKDVRSKKQYFGMSSDTLDIDILKYHGVYLYDDKGDISTPSGLTKGFHMDAILGRQEATILVDGQTGFTFDCVSPEIVSSKVKIPRIIKSSYINETIYEDETLRKFTVYFYGGFDGWDVNRAERTNTDKYKATKYAVTTTANSESSVFKLVKSVYNGLNLPLDLPDNAITSDYYAYLAGYRVYSNPQDIDINVLSTPGINWLDHKLLTLDVIDMIEDSDYGRGGDVLYIMNSPENEIISELISELNDSDIETSYACTYFPWITYFDSFNNQYISLSPTKDVVRNIAKTDNNAYPWFAPAGFERGNVKCVKANFKTTLPQEDMLYENRINPVKTFGKDGVKIWGNKTTYTTDSPLNRINVRRLMIRVKKLVSNAARHLIFEQYDDTLEKQFRGLVEPILAEVKSNKGIYDYRVMTEVTPETRDQHILPARILIKPTPALEYISISFVVYPESVAFDD